MPSKLGFGNTRKKSSAMPMYGKSQKNPVKKVEEFEKIPSKPAPKGIDVHSKVR